MLVAGARFLLCQLSVWVQESPVDRSDTLSMKLFHANFPRYYMEIIVKSTTTALAYSNLLGRELVFKSARSVVFLSEVGEKSLAGGERVTQHQSGCRSNMKHRTTRETGQGLTILFLYFYRRC